VLKCLFGANEADRSWPAHTLAFDQLSDGQRQLLMLYTLLEVFVRAGSTLCIDEPENFVALRELQPWVWRLENSIEKHGGQCILASHHPEIIDRLDVANIVLLSRDGDGTTQALPFPTESVGEDMLTASEVLARSWEEP
jgi:predicted ATPase